MAHYTEGGISIKEAIEAFLRYTDKPMIASRDAVLEGLKQACNDKLIGIARGVSLNNLQKTWCGESVMLDPNEEGVWIIPKFEVEPVALASQPRDVSQPTTTGTQPSPGEVDGQPATGTSPTAAPTKQIRRIRISGEVPLDSWADVFRSFVSPAARMKLKKMRLGVDFELETRNEESLTPDDPTLKAMEESARQLGLEIEKE